MNFKKRANRRKTSWLSGFFRERKMSSSVYSSWQRGIHETPWSHGLWAERELKNLKQKKNPFFPSTGTSKLIFIPFLHQLLICLARVCFVPRPRPNSFYRRLHEPLGSFKFKRRQLIIALWFLMWKHARLIGPDPRSLEGKQQWSSAGKKVCWTSWMFHKTVCKINKTSFLSSFLCLLLRPVSSAWFVSALYF